MDYADSTAASISESIIPVSYSIVFLLGAKMGEMIYKKPPPPFFVFPRSPFQYSRNNKDSKSL